MQRTAALILLAALSVRSAQATAEQLTARLRFAWGSSAQSPLNWHGAITAEGAALEVLQPLGIEPDEAAAMSLVENRVVIAPLVRRAFDGCDVTIRGDATTVIKVELRSGLSAAPQVVEATLGHLAREKLHQSIDELGSYVIVQRCPGDLLRVEIAREHLVFRPGEAFQVLVSPDLALKAAKSGITVEAQLLSDRGGGVRWNSSKPYDAAATEPIAFDAAAPAEEGAYRMTFTATRSPDGLAGKLVPWEQREVVVSREVGFVVIDPSLRLPRLADGWEAVTTIDPANTTWWQRLPQWTSFEKLPGFSTPRPLGNVRPLLNPPDHPGLVQLPPRRNLPAPSGDEPAWQAYLLGVRRVGEPHAVEIELPRGERQHLAVSIIEPDASGRVFGFGRDCGVYSDGRASTRSDGMEVHRIVFWPRTKSPAILLANRSSARAATYGKIHLLRRSTEPATGAPSPAAPTAASETTTAPRRVVAAYIATPRFADAMGAVEQLDDGSKLSVDGWQTFLDATNRLAQQLKADGYNAAIISIAADGSSLAPIKSLGFSPRYDTGPLAASGADPLRKDVLELLLRVFDREGLRLLPAVQLSTPLPGLEAMRPTGDERVSGFTWIGPDGKAWNGTDPSGTAVAPHYNILNAEVQKGVAAIATELTARYGKHTSLGGVALQLSGAGFGVLPGSAWGMDDATVARFARDMKVTIDAAGPDRFQRRASQLLGPQQLVWKTWRRDQLTLFYAGLAKSLAAQRPDFQLVLCTENLFAGDAATEYLRQAVAGRAPLEAALDEVGVDARQLAATPGIALLRPRRLSAIESVDLAAADERVNAAPEFDLTFAAAPRAGELLFHTSATLRLPSFDEQSPFGASKTFLSLSSPSFASGDDARRGMITALAARDSDLVVNGADTLPLAANEAHAEALRIVQSLPPTSAVIRAERRQPVTLRVYREAESITICLLNESPWPVDVTLPLEGVGSEVIWRQLGSADATQGQQGTLSAGPQSWLLTLPPFGIAARCYASTSLRVGTLAPQVADAARNDLQDRISEIELRMQNLDAERPYNQLQNPQFELTGENGRVLGWQPRIGAAGAVDLVELDKTNDAPTAGRAIHLRSQDATGVAVQSHLFDMPSTGQLVVRAKARAAAMEPGAQLYAWVEFPSGNATRQRYVALGGAAELKGEWTECEFAIDDLPLGASGQMRIQFHLCGKGQAWIDDVRLYDLRFPKSQREALAKRLYAAKTALEENQYVDCQRLVEGYWPRRLVEHVRPQSLASRPADAPPAPSTVDAKEGKSFNDRLRGMVPRILR